jgi:hypothetical protein
MSKISHEFDQYNWSSVEKNADPYTKLVITCLINLGSNTKYSLCQEFNILGDEYYVIIRDLLNSISNKNLINEPYVLKTEKVIKAKKDLIRADNAKRILIEQLQSYITQDIHKILTHDILEFKAIGLIYYSWEILNTTDINYEKIYSLIIILQKFIKIMPTITGYNKLTHNTTDIRISNRCIKDIEYWLKMILNKYPFDGLTIAKMYPKLLIYTEFDNAIPTITIEPKQHQIELMRNITDNFDNGFFLIYKAMIGSGKTSTAIAVAQYINMLRKQKCNKTLIFACNLESVKLQVATLCFNANIPFAIGSITTDVSKMEKNVFAINNNIDQHIRIQKNYNCKNNDDNIVVIITSPQVAIELLKHDVNKKYILYLDEPTIGADNINSLQLAVNVALIACMPKHIILSSATFPNESDISCITNIYKTEHSTGIIKTIIANKIDIGCNIKTLDNQIVVPHIGCITKAQITKVVNDVINCPFLGRTYTIDILYDMCQKLKIPTEFFNDSSNLSSEMIKQKCLEILTNINEKDISNICSYPNTIKQIDLSKITNVDAYKYPYQSLIVSEDPIKFIADYIIPYYEPYVEMFSLKLDQYKLEMDIYNNELNKINLPMANKKQDKQDKEENQSKCLSKKLDKIISDKPNKYNTTNNTSNSYTQLVNNKPKFEFPNEMQINTRDHLLKFNNSSQFIRPLLDFEEIINTDISAANNIMLLLFCGIGIYTPSLTASYNNYVLELANEGKLAYLISDNSICYGTNYPINRVIIMKDYADLHSLNTLYQLMGRAGRVGKSWSAEIIIDPSTAPRILANSDTSEIDNINSKFLECYELNTKRQNLDAINIMKELKLI